MRHLSLSPLLPSNFMGQRSLHYSFITLHHDIPTSHLPITFIKKWANSFSFHFKTFLKNLFLSWLVNPYPPEADHTPDLSLFTSMGDTPLSWLLISYLSEVSSGDTPLSWLVKRQECLSNLHLMLWHSVLQTGNDLVSRHCVGPGLGSSVHSCTPAKYDEICKLLQKWCPLKEHYNLRGNKINYFIWHHISLYCKSKKMNIA